MSLPNDVTKEMRTTPLTRGINLMVYLLDGVTYSELYSKPLSDGTVTSGLGKLMANADALDQHPDLQTDPQGNSYDVKAQLVGPSGVLTQIESMLKAAGYPADAHLDTLFLEKAAAGSPLAEIVSLLSKFFIDAGGRMNHFCTPFLYMQEHDSYITPGEWSNFIGACGDRTLGELYQADKWSIRKAVQQAKKNKILIDNSKSVGTYAPQGGNGKWCSNNSCVDSGDPETWCNLIEDGSECSPMSDHAP